MCIRLGPSPLPRAPPFSRALRRQKSDDPQDSEAKLRILGTTAICPRSVADHQINKCQQCQRCFHAVKSALILGHLCREGSWMTLILAFLLILTTKSYSMGNHVDHQIINTREMFKSLCFFGSLPTAKNPRHPAAISRQSRQSSSVSRKWGGNSEGSSRNSHFSKDYWITKFCWPINPLFHTDTHCSICSELNSWFPRL